MRMRTRRGAAGTTVVLLTGVLSAPAVAHATASTVFHVAQVAGCSDSTIDSAATPYCTIQAAVNAAAGPGDTVSIQPGTYAPFTESSSGTSAAPITIEAAAGRQMPPRVVVENQSGPAATFSGSSYVDVEGLMLQGGLQTVLKVTGSSTHDITVDGSYIEQGGTGDGTPMVDITGGATAITISRDFLETLVSNAPAIAVTNSSADLITTNRISASPVSPGVVLTGSVGSDVTSNTVTQACGWDVAATGGSTTTSIENNILTGLVPAAEGCGQSNAAAAVLMVDQTSAQGTVADYNDVYPAHPADAALSDYSWAGVPYATATALTAATGEGAHDSNSGAASAAIDSANSAAPGELTTDYSGNPRVDDPLVADTGAGDYTYYDRGAVEAEDPIGMTSAANWPKLMPVSTVGTFTLDASDAWTGVGIASCTYDFGDGSSPVEVKPVGGKCSTSYSYSAVGGYTIRVTVASADGYSRQGSFTLTVGTQTQLLPQAAIEVFGSRDVYVGDSGSSGWNVVSRTVDFGDGTSAPIPLGQTGVPHHYAGVGTYTVTVTDTDSDGNVASATAEFNATGYYFNPVDPVRVLDTRKPIGVPTAAKVAPGGVVALKLAGTNGIPVGATAVALNVTVADAATGGFVTAYPDGTATPKTSNLDFARGQVLANIVVVKLGADGSIDLKNSGTGTVDLVADLEGYYAVTGDAYAVGTADRIMDTRLSKQTIPANGVLRVQTGYTSPATVAAATLNVTVTNPTASGFITAYADGTSVPASSNIDFTPHLTVANEVIAKVAANGYVDFKNNSGGTVDLIVDENGAFAPVTGVGGVGSGAFTPIAPIRMLDTRSNLGDFKAAGRLATGALPAYGVGLLGIGGDQLIPGIPATAEGVAMNLTVTAPTAGGYIEAYPSEQSTRPAGSTLNFAPGQTIANAASIAISGTTPGGVQLYNGSSGSVQLVVDVFGYYD